MVPSAYNTVQAHTELEPGSCCCFMLEQGSTLTYTVGKNKVEHTKNCTL